MNRIRIQSLVSQLAFVAVPFICMACGSQKPPESTPAPPNVIDFSPLKDGPDGAHEGALRALAYSPWLNHADARAVVSIPLPDGVHWTPVHYWGVKSISAFRYGDDHHAAAIVTIFPRKRGQTLDGCMQRFSDWASGFLQWFGVRIGPPNARHADWRSRPGEKILLAIADASRWFGHEIHYDFAVAAYPAFANQCVVVGFSVYWEDQKDAPAAAWIRNRMAQLGLPSLLISRSIDANLLKESYLGAD